MNRSDSLSYMLAYDVGESVEVLLRIGSKYTRWGSAGEWSALKITKPASCLGKNEGCGGIVPWG